MKLFNSGGQSGFPKRMYYACMVGLSLGIPAVAVLPKIVTVAEANPRCYYNGAMCEIDHISKDGKSVSIIGKGVPSRGVPASDVEMIPRWKFWKYQES